MKKTQKTSVEGVDTVTEGLETSASVLQELIEELGEGLHGNGEHEATIKSVCRAVTALSTVAAELRARTKAKIKERDSLTPAVVMEWLRAQPDEMKLHIVREISSALDETSVLA